MERYVISATGRRYRLTIATKKSIQAMVRNTKEKIFFADAYKNNKTNKAYICYNTEYYLPAGFHMEADVKSCESCKIWLKMCAPSTECKGCKDYSLWIKGD